MSALSLYRAVPPWDCGVSGKTLFASTTLMVSTASDLSHAFASEEEWFAVTGSTTSLLRPRSSMRPDALCRHAY